MGLCISLAVVDLIASRCWQSKCWSQESMQTAVEHNEASLAAELLTMLRETVEEVPHPLSSALSPPQQVAPAVLDLQRLYNSAATQRLWLCGLQAGRAFRLDEGQCLCLLDCAAHSTNRRLAQAAWEVLQASIRPGIPGPWSVPLQG